MAGEKQTYELLTELTAKVDQLYTALNGAMEKFDQYGKKSKEANKEVENGFVIAKVAIALAVRELDHFIMEATLAAAESEAFAIVLGTLADHSNVSRRAIDDQTESLMRMGFTSSASHKMLATLIQGNIDVSNASKLASVALDLAARSGMGYTEALDTLGQTILTGNVRTLRQFGITTSVAGIFQEYAKQVHKTTEELTDLDRRQAIVNAILEKSNSLTGLHAAVAETADDRMKQLNSRWEEAKEQLGANFVPLLNMALGAALKLVKAFQDSSPATKGFIATIVGAVAVVGSLVVVLGSIVTLWPVIVGALRSMAAAFAMLGVSLPIVTALALALIGLSAALNIFNEKVEKELARQTEHLHKVKDAAIATNAEIVKLARTDPGAAFDLFDKKKKSLLEILAQEKGISDFARERATLQLNELLRLEKQLGLKKEIKNEHRLTKEEIEAEQKAEKEWLEEQSNRFRETGMNARNLLESIEEVIKAHKKDAIQQKVDEEFLRKLRHDAAMEEMRERRRLMAQFSSEFASTIAGQIVIFGKSTMTMEQAFEAMIDRMVQKIVESGILTLLGLIFNVPMPGSELFSGILGIGQPKGFDSPANDALAFAAGGKWFDDALNNFSQGYVKRFLSNPNTSSVMGMAAAGGGVQGGQSVTHFSYSPMFGFGNPGEIRRGMIEMTTHAKRQGVNL